MDNNVCKVLIPACGQSVRFKEKTNLPKGLVEFKWKEGDRRHMMLTHIIEEMPAKWKFAVICQNQDFALFSRLNEKFDIFSLVSSAGQADTIFQALRYGYGRVAPHEDFLVVNSDNAILGLRDAVESFRMGAKNVGAVVFQEESGGSRFGFIDAFPFFTRGAEKNRISDYALAGAFWFRSPHYFNMAYLEAINAVREPRELYISMLFEHVRGGGAAYPIPRSSLYEWGTWQHLENDQSVKIDWSKQRE